MHRRGIRSALSSLGKVASTLALSCTLPACGGSDDAPKTSQTPLSFVGSVAETNVRVGAVASGRHALLYFCGAGSSLNTWTRWISAERSETGELSFPAGGWQLSGSFHGTVLDGTVAPAGEQAHAFHAIAANAGTLFGLYETQAPCGRVGLIVSASDTGDSASAQGACTGDDPAGDRQVIPIMPLTRASDGTIGVTVDGDEQVLHVSPATVSP